MNSTSVQGQRFYAIDALRGTAIAMMFVYHFSFDLAYFKFIQQDFYHDPFWLNFRTLIVSTFLFVMGFSLYLAHHRGVRVKKFLQRLLILILFAGLVSLASYMMYPRSFIFFGILHFIAVASVLGLLFIRLYWLNLFIGAGIILFDYNFSHTVFNHKALQWIGLMTHKPVTEDYVPLIPWFGVVLIGIFFARWSYGEGNFPTLSNWRNNSAPSRLLQFAGRHSLIIYMLHQPVFIGVLYAIHISRS